MRQRLSRFLLGATCTLALSPACGKAAETQTELGALEVFGELATERLMETQGHNFSVSPDEHWIVVAYREVLEPYEPARYRHVALWVLHVPTRKRWVYEVDRLKSPTGGDSSPVRIGDLGDWYPNCFSEDSSRLFVGEFSAPLVPDMGSLAFERQAVPKDLDRLEGTFLGFSGELRNPDGTRASSWSTWRGDRDFAWGPGSRVLYEAVGGRDEASRIRVSPPGLEYAIDFRPLVETQDRVLQEMSDARLSKYPPSEREKIRAESDAVKAKIFGFLGPHRSLMKVRRLAVSPSARWLAASASFLDGAGGPGHGALIALDAKPLRARLYSERLDRVLGKPIWSPDSRRLYFVGSTSEDVGPGETRNIDTVYRLQLRE